MKYSKNFKADKSGKSLALFFKKETNLFQSNLINKLVDIYKKKRIETRICLHRSKQSNMQVMINLIILKKKYQLHFHKFSSEYYIPLRGKLRLIIFNKKGKFIKYLDVDKKKGIIGKIIKGQVHVAIPKSKFCVYLEFRAGNFNRHKNIFLDKFITVQNAMSLK